SVGEFEENDEDSAHHDVGGGRSRHEPAADGLFGGSIGLRRCGAEGLDDHRVHRRTGQPRLHLHLGRGDPRSADGERLRVPVRLDDEGEIQPGLAEDWSLSDDRRTYTFDLREGVKFSNGADLTSEDVKFSYERVQDEWKNELKSKMDIVESIETPD